MMEQTIFADLDDDGVPLIVIPTACEGCGEVHHHIAMSIDSAELRNFAEHCLAVCNLADAMARIPTLSARESGTA